MDLRSLQRPLKDRYREDPTCSRITLSARGGQTDAPISCSIDLGRAIYSAQAHAGRGRGGNRRMFRRPPSWCVSGLRADHLPNGCRRHGDPH